MNTIAEKDQKVEGNYSGSDTGGSDEVNPGELTFEQGQLR